jgi:hypothetical protein
MVDDTGARVAEMFTRLAAALITGEQLLGSIGADQMREEVAKALDQFEVARNILGQLQSAVNVLNAGGPPSEPTNPAVGRKQPVHAMDSLSSGLTLCGVRWAGHPEVRLGILPADRSRSQYGPITCRFCRKRADHPT